MSKESLPFDVSIVKNIDVYSQVMPYIGISFNNTSAKGFVCIDNVAQSINNESYFVIKEYEEKYQTSSREMLEKWRVGDMYGTDITDWIMNYMTVKDRLHEPSVSRYSH